MKIKPQEIMKMVENVYPYFEPALIAAIAMQESGGETYAIRHESNYKWIVKDDKYFKDKRWTGSTELMMQKTSWGLMQIMGATAREHQFDGWLTRLLIPKINIYYGSIHFDYVKGRYPKLEDAISAYNAGSPRMMQNGQYENQSYVDSVMRHYNEFKD